MASRRRGPGKDKPEGSAAAAWPPARHRSIGLVLQLQRTIGNRAVQRLLPEASRVRVTTPGDSLEQAADRTARRALDDEAPADPASVAPVRSAGNSAGLFRQSILGRGRPLPGSTRAFFEPRLGRDLSRVRVHEGGDAAAVADAFSARAVTAGEDVVFGAGEFQPGTRAGRGLLAHELAHVGQQQAGVAARTVSPDYSRIKSNLSYGLFDWAITDADARQVLTSLAALAPADFDDTLRQMEADGLVSRLLENVASADETAFAAVLRKLHRGRSVASSAAHIESLMSYGLLDWAVTDAEAHLALQALLSLKTVPGKLRDVVMRIPEKQWERFFDNLSGRDKADTLRFLQDLEMIRRTGQTFAEMATAQKTFLESGAAAAGQSVGTFIRGEVASRGFGGNAATWWPSLTPPLRAAWTSRFNDVVAKVKAAAPPEIEKVIKEAEGAGGGIRFEPVRTEEFGAFGFREGNWLSVGKDWIESAETEPYFVFDNISHELGGHRQYGPKASWDVMEATLAALPPGERAIAESGPKAPYSAYGYMETEIYAELRELPYRNEGSESDDPVQDVEDQLTKIRAAFAPSIAEAIVRGMRRRFQADAQLTSAARALFDEKVRVVFAITFD